MTLHAVPMPPSPGERIPSGLRRRHQVVVIGSGFGGLAATGLARADVDVTVVASTPHHLFQPLLYQVATGVLSEGEVAPPTREVLRRQANARVLLGDVLASTWTAGGDVAGAGRETQLPYDSLIVAAGAGQSYFGNDRFARVRARAEDHRRRAGAAWPDLRRLRAGRAGSDRGEDVSGLLTFVVVGAGPTGVEMAGQIAELARRTLRRDFRPIDPREAGCILLDGGRQVLPPFGEQLGDGRTEPSSEMGVEVELGARSPTSTTMV